MRILILSYEFPPVGGGGSRVVYGLATNFARLGHDVDVITMGFNELPQVEPIEGATVYRLTKIRKSPAVCHTREMAFFTLATLRFIARLARERSYDINHTHFIFPGGVTALLLKKLCGLPYVLTAHGSDVPGYNPDRFQLQHVVLGPLWKQVVKKANCVVYPSEYLKGLAVKRIEDVKSPVIPNGFDPSRYNPNKSRQMRILCVTRMLERKGVQFVLQALNRIEVDCEVNIVGDGPYLEKLQQLNQELGGRAKFWGWLDNDSPILTELYETSTVFVSTSTQENFPVTLLEAMAAGMAIVSAGDTGGKEVVGDAAVLVQPDDPSQIADALARLCHDPHLCAELGKRARRRVEENFNWPVIAQAYLDVLRKEARCYGS